MAVIKANKERNETKQLLSQEDADKAQLNSLKEYLIQYLEGVNGIISKSNKSESVIFNNFTLECIEMLKVMIKFDIIDEKEYK